MRTRVLRLFKRRGLVAWANGTWRRHLTGGDGTRLALGETTPGPLIMAVAFVGFIGASTQEGSSAPRPAAAGAGVATFFTFLPSFLFILCGAPLVAATHGDLKVHRAAHRHHRRGGGVVVVNLAVFFAWHVLWPAGTGAAPFAGGFEWLAARRQAHELSRDRKVRDAERLARASREGPLADIRNITLSPWAPGPSAGSRRSSGSEGVAEPEPRAAL